MVRVVTRLIYGMHGGGLNCRLRRGAETNSSTHGGAARPKINDSKTPMEILMVLIYEQKIIYPQCKVCVPKQLVAYFVHSKLKFA